MGCHSHRAASTFASKTKPFLFRKHRKFPFPKKEKVLLGGSFIREESVLNFGWFLRPEMSRLGLYFGGIVDMWESQVQIKYFMVSLLHNEIF